MAQKKLTPEEFPFTGPLSRALQSKSPTVISLKRAMSRMGYLPWAKFDPIFNLPLERALDKWDPGADGYGKGRWNKIRGARVPMSLVHGGELALDSIAVALVKEEAEPPVFIPPYVYPHPLGADRHIPTFLHPTRGLPGNIALDFLAAPGTPLLASFTGEITRLSGHDPFTGVHGIDSFGWSIYLERNDGMFAYMTHCGRKDVHVGQHVSVGQQIGTVGHWPFDIGRSHTHLGITSPRGIRDATHIVLTIAAAPQLPSV
jgi:hypothetical protein